MAFITLHCAFGHWFINAIETFTFLYNIKETETDKFQTKINTGTKSRMPQRFNNTMTY